MDRAVSLLVLPALAFYAIFLALPIVGVLIISLLNWSGLSMSDISWAGLTNYQALANDPVFWQALLHNLIFIGGGASAVVVLGLTLAVLLEQGLRGSNFFRGVFFIPTVLSFVVVGIVFMLILSPELGLINPLLRGAHLGGLQRAWLGERATALPTVIGVDVWKNFGLSMFLFVAGLKGHSARILRGRQYRRSQRLERFCEHHPPALRPVTAVVVTLASINSLKLFDLVYVMTAGGPNHSSEVLTTWMYQQGFKFNNMGYGSAIAVVLLIVTFVLTAIQLKVLSRGQD